MLNLISMRLEQKSMPEPNSGCWLWLEGIGAAGYGVMRDPRYTNRPAYAHRLAYEIYKGPIPAGQNVLHKCNTAICINPEHLYAGSQQQNMRDWQKLGKGKPSLTYNDVQYIKGSLESLEALAERFQVSRTHIDRIQRGYSYKSS